MRRLVCPWDETRLPAKPMKPYYQRWLASYWADEKTRRWLRGYSQRQRRLDLGPPKARYCVWCGEGFQPGKYPSPGHDWPKTCSTECGSAMLSEVKSGPKVERRCVFCERPFSARPRSIQNHCSEGSCSWDHARALASLKRDTKFGSSDFPMGLIRLEAARLALRRQARRTT